MHQSVLLQPVVDYLRPNREDGTLVDATVGMGGHAEALLERYPRDHLVAIDRDPRALKLARERLGRFGSRVTFAQGRHESLIDILQPVSIEPDEIWTDNFETAVTRMRSRKRGPKKVI